MNKKALFAISTLGLGHASRTLPVIQMYLEKGFSLDIVCDGKALLFLKNELQGKNVSFLQLRDYPALERGSGISFYAFLISDLLTTYIRIKREQFFLKGLLKQSKYEFIFSDGKYGFHSKKVPSYILSHQVSFDIPKIFSFSQRLMDWFNKKYFSKYDMLFIPDYADKSYNLAGKLSHPQWVHKIKNYKYIGIISGYHSATKETSINNDFLFTISGYLEQHRQGFIGKLLEAAKQLPGKKVFMLGNTKQNTKDVDKENNITIFSFLAGQQKLDYFTGANTIISRAGYTTIMDLIELDKKAILYPTPNQTEQEYLARYLGKKGVFITGKDANNVVQLSKNLENIQLPNFPSKTKEALKTIYDIIGK